jgi:hypothetical protein
MKWFNVVIFLLLSFIGYNQPSNNGCLDAIEILLPNNNDTICVSGTTVNATSTYINSFYICGNNGQDVWYKFTTPETSGNWNISFIRNTIKFTVEVNLFKDNCNGEYMGYVCFQNNSSFSTYQINGDVILDINTTYYLLIYNEKVANDNGQGTFDICINKIDILLPITLVYFNVKNINNYNYLSWLTSSEINNDYFTLERSSDGNHWETIDNQKGNGNRSTSSLYEYYDYTFLSGKNYYQLTQYDFDGKSEKFNIISIDNKIDESGILKIYDIYGNEIQNITTPGIYIILTNNGEYQKKFIR